MKMEESPDFVDGLYNCGFHALTLEQIANILNNPNFIVYPMIDNESKKFSDPEFQDLYKKIMEVPENERKFPYQIALYTYLDNGYITKHDMILQLFKSLDVFKFISVINELLESVKQFNPIKIIKIASIPHYKLQKEHTA